jgi:VWFA-related protein
MREVIMKRTIALALSLSTIFSVAFAQTPSTPQKPPQEIAPEDIVRVTTQLVQTDVVVTDKNDKIIKDLKLEDFELYDNGKKQDLKFLEFVGVEGADKERRSEGARPSAPGYVEPAGNTGVSARDLKRVVAFVVDDLTMEAVDLPSVRKMMLDFVDNKMRDGDLVAIVRVVGGNGLLQQFTTDRQLLRRAIASIRVVLHPFADIQSPDAPKMDARALQAQGLNPEAGAPSVDSPLSATDNPEIFSPNDDTIRYFRGLAALSTASYVMQNLKDIPGRKNLVLITNGLSLFQGDNSGNINFSSLFDQLSDNAFRAGVVLNTLDPRGLRATPGVKGFQATPAKSAMVGGNPTFGRGDPGIDSALGSSLDGALEHQGLSTVAKATGGISAYNTNDFISALDKIMARSDGYYTLAYTPNEKFDNKSHRLEIKVKRSGMKVSNHSKYFAREDKSTGPKTKEEDIAAAARSPLMKAEIDVTPNVAVKLMPGKAAVDIHMLISVNKFHFTEADGKYQTTFDVVGFVFDQMGRNRGGFSDTVNLNLSKEDYQRALVEGVTYTASTELPAGNNFQVRAVVREASSGSLGTFSKYLEIPDLSKGRLAMSSLFFLSVDPTTKKTVSLQALRQLNRKQELRYVAMIYNPKLKDGKPQLHSQMIITQGNKELFREPEQPVESNGTAPVTKMGQLGLSKVAPGRYVLTLVITDTLADKKNQTMAHSLDFTVVN